MKCCSNLRRMQMIAQTLACLTSGCSVAWIGSFAVLFAVLSGPITVVESGGAENWGSTLTPS